MASISIEKLSKIYPDGTHAVRGVDLEIEDGRCLALVGPSGCGKTTLLRMIAGLESVTGGTLRIGDREVESLPPQERDIAMVFQNYALYPHMSVRDNMAYGLKRRRMAKAEIGRRVATAAEMLELTDLLEKKPAALSGGQRQRVAMGRAIVREPAAFLMDEPLSNLDAKLRTQMRAQLGRMRQELEVTTVYVTHDQVEALTLGDQVAVMLDGEVQQLAAPRDLYESPANLFVANFIGSPPMNTIEAAVEMRGREVYVAFAGNRIKVPEAEVERRPALVGCDGCAIALGIRPEHVSISRGAEAPNGSVITATLELSELLGGIVDLHFPIAARAVVADPERLDGGDLGSGASGARSDFIVRIAADDVSRGIEVGDEMRLCLDPRSFHYFELDSGRSLN